MHIGTLVQHIINKQVLQYNPRYVVVNNTCSAMGGLIFHAYPIVYLLWRRCFSVMRITSAMCIYCSTYQIISAISLCVAVSYSARHVLFFCSIILAFSLTKTMAAHYFIRFLSAVPKAHWQRPNTPVKKFVNRAQGNSWFAPEKVRPKEKSHRTPVPHTATHHSARQRKTQDELQSQEPEGHYPPGSSSSSLITPAAATALSSSSSSLSQFSSTGGAARPT